MKLDGIDRVSLLNLAEEIVCTGGGVDELAAHVACRWTAGQVCGLLGNTDASMARLACEVLARHGEEGVEPCLLRTLKDGRQCVALAAESALWAIWFRGGNVRSQVSFRNGLTALKAGDHHRAVLGFVAAQRHDPFFAEAFHQAAVASYLQGRWVPAMEEAERTLNLRPAHFGAMACLGHCHFQLGNLAEATRWYGKSLSVNPTMGLVKHALMQIQRCTAFAR